MVERQELDFKEDLQTAKDYWDAGDADAAIAIYLKIIKINPNIAKVHNYLGVIRATQDNLDEAVSCYQRAISIDLDYAHAYNNLGVVLSKKDETEWAINCYEKAISLQPDFDLPYKNLINLVLEKKPKAIPYERLLEIAHQYVNCCRDCFPVSSLANFLHVSLAYGTVTEQVRSYLSESRKLCLCP